MPSPLHESVSSLLAEKFGVMKDSLTPQFKRTINMKLGQDYKRFDGQWRGSQKRPDLAFERVNADGAPEVKWVLEAGFSEDYERLVRDAKLWLEGCLEVSMVVLVKFHETPSYRCPVLPQDDLGQLGIPPVAAQVLFRDFVSDEEYGPVSYKGLAWVGTISEVFLETWKRDANGSAIRYGNRRNLLGSADDRIRFQLRHILDIPVGNTSISFSLDDFQHLLKTSVKQLAVDRCAEMLNARARREGEGY
jgi:hypothetical protein